nr:GNAT family N-acetyltransferase [Prevotella sp.]
MYSIEYTNGNDDRFVELCHQLDLYLTEIIGSNKQETQYAQYNTLADIHNVVLIIEDNQVIGCGAIKQYDTHTMEMKRVFVKGEHRHHGYGHVIIESLEKLAKDKDFDKLILETGVPLIHAQKMYASCGFKPMDNYGQYEGVDSSVCMYKNI